MNQKKSRRKKITTVKGLYQSKGTSYEEVQETTRKRVAVELLARGVRPEIIYSEAWGLDPGDSAADIRDAFSDLFGMPYSEIMQTNWIPFVEGWLEFYGISID
jgi:hypothetical protein